MAGCSRNEVGELVSALLYVRKVKHPFGESLEKARRASLQHITARAQKCCARGKLSAEGKQVALIPTCAVQKE